MSTEQKPAPATNPPQPKAEPNVLAQSLAGGWEKFKQGKLISYTAMAVILLVVAAVGATWWIVSERRKAESAKWTELDEDYRLASPAALDEYAKKYPGTIQAKLAMLEIARTHLGPDGIDKMFIKANDLQTPSAGESENKARTIRDAAVKNVELAREEFAKLVDEFKDDPVIRVECMLACAKAEAVLVGIPKEGKVDFRDPGKPLPPAEGRGDPNKAIEWLDKVAEAAPDTDWGKDSKKLADALRNKNTEQQVRLLQNSVFDVSPALPFGGPGIPGMPGLPGLPGMPGGPHAGLPGLP
jgi:hypothetical protein